MADRRILRSGGTKVRVEMDAYAVSGLVPALLGIAFSFRRMDVPDFRDFRDQFSSLRKQLAKSSKIAVSLVKRDPIPII